MYLMKLSVPRNRVDAPLRVLQRHDAVTTPGGSTFTLKSRSRLIKFSTMGLHAVRSGAARARAEEYDMIILLLSPSFKA
jgi:hypothetical protein